MREPIGSGTLGLLCNPQKDLLVPVGGIYEPGNVFRVNVFDRSVLGNVITKESQPAFNVRLILAEVVLRCFNISAFVAVGCISNSNQIKVLNVATSRPVVGNVGSEDLHDIIVE